MSKNLCIETLSIQALAQIEQRIVRTGKVLSMHGSNQSENGRDPADRDNREVPEEVKRRVIAMAARLEELDEYLIFQGPRFHKAPENS